MFNKINEMCSFAFCALDGLYGWMSEVIALVLFVFVFNIVVKWILRKLHKHFEQQKKIWKDCFVRALYTPLSYYVWFFAAIQTLDLIAAKIYHEMPIDNRHTILNAGAAIAFTWFLFRWKRLIVVQMIIKAKNREITVDQGKIAAIDKVLTVFIFFFAVLVLLEISHRSVNTIIAFGGIGGLALAFASQEIIANFFGGFMIYLTQPFTIGDWILIPDHSIEGIVEEVGWYMTRVRSLDKKPIYIPNAIFSKLIVITPSRMSHRQIKEVISIRYDDIHKLRPIVHDIKEMLQQHHDIDHHQPVMARFSSFGQNALEITVQAYTLTVDTIGFMKVKEDVLIKVADIIEKHHAEFPTSTHLVTLISNKDRQEEITG